MIAILTVPNPLSYKYKIPDHRNAKDSVCSYCSHWIPCRLVSSENIRALHQIAIVAQCSYSKKNIMVMYTDFVSIIKSSFFLGRRLLRSPCGAVFIFTSLFPLCTVRCFCRYSLSTARVRMRKIKVNGYSLSHQFRFLLELFMKY